MKAQYWIAQYIEDVFRNEPKNVGIIARIGDDIVAQFIGETKTGEVDGRKLRLFKCPDVYREWVLYWRRMIGRGLLDKLLNQTGSNFRVNQGGFVTDIGGDTTEAVVTYLYSLLVSEGGFKEALTADEKQHDEAEKALEDEVANMFSQRRLMVGAVEDLFVRSPIKRNVIVAGKSYKSHRPAFVQENGLLYVMETADFTTAQKKRQRDHAGLAAYMFKDVRQERQDAQTIALVRVHEVDLNNDDVDYGLTILKAEARIIYWFDQNEREQFLREREEVARN